MASKRWSEGHRQGDRVTEDSDKYRRREKRGKGARNSKGDREGKIDTE